MHPIYLHTLGQFVNSDVASVILCTLKELYIKQLTALDVEIMVYIHSLFPSPMKVKILRENCYWHRIGGSTRLIYEFGISAFIINPAAPCNFFKHYLEPKHVVHLQHKWNVVTRRHVDSQTLRMRSVL
jgi:hypothetical protein